MPLKIESRDRWTELVLAQPPRNILDTSLLEALVAALDELARGEAPLILLRSEGKHFSTGYPIEDIPEEIFHHDPHVRAGTPFEQAMDRLTHYPAPIVAAVQGDAYGGAVELLACCDLRVAAEGVRLGVPPVRLGLIYSHTGLRRLIRGFGSPLVREMLLTGEAVAAERAFQSGFFCRLVPANDLEGAATALLDDMSRGGPAALKGTRRILNLLEETEVLPAESLTEIARLRHESRSSEEFVKAREAFINREGSPFG
jgi:enoyl-CoA hydratase/carnithine racemase